VAEPACVIGVRGLVNPCTNVFLTEEWDYYVGLICLDWPWGGRGVVGADFFVVFGCDCGNGFNFEVVVE